jgi:hypothetical protein
MSGHFSLNHLLRVLASCIKQDFVYGETEKYDLNQSNIAI